MKLFRFLHKSGPRYGALEGDGLALVVGDIFGEWERTEEMAPFSGARLLAPVTPSKVVALGLNYRDHAKEMGVPAPDEPIIFLKPSTSVTGPGEPVFYPLGMTERVDYEAELGIVIGRNASRVREADAGEYILGYTCVNDVTARDLQAKDGQWSRAKGFDSFCPIGPCIETELDPGEQTVQAILNGKVVQDSSTKELIFNAHKVVELVSMAMTLLPGDVIATGTPPGVGPMKPGDTVTVKVSGIGMLTNKVNSRPPDDEEEEE